MAFGTCTIANQHCVAAANFHEYGAPVLECFSCGLEVCTAPGCSRRTAAYSGSRGKRVRICFDCASPGGCDLPELLALMNADIARAAGYLRLAQAIRRGEATLHDNPYR